MPQVTTNEVKPGMKIEMEKEPYLVVSNQFVKPGKGQAFNRIKLKNIKTARVVEKTFKSGEKMDLADVEESQLRFLYKEGTDAIFMDDKTYEQTHIPLTVIEPNVQWLKDDCLYDVVLYKGTPIEVTPPTFMELKITESAPGVKGDTASGRVLKPATLETGAQIQVPIFVDEGEMIKVDTRTAEYVSRAN